MPRSCLVGFVAVIVGGLGGCAAITETRRVELGQTTRETRFAGFDPSGNEAVLLSGERQTLELSYRSGSACFDEVTTTTQRRTVIERKAQGSPLLLPVLIGTAGVASVGLSFVPPTSQQRADLQGPLIAGGLVMTAVGVVWAVIEGVRQVDGSEPHAPLVTVASVGRKCERLPIGARSLKLQTDRQELEVETSVQGRAAIPLAVATAWFLEASGSLRDEETGLTVTPRWLDSGAALVAEAVDSRAAWGRYLALFPQGARAEQASVRVAALDRLADEQRRQRALAEALGRVAALEQAGRLREAREALSQVAARGGEVGAKDESLRQALEARGRAAIERARQFTKQNKPDDALEALAEARRDDVDDPRLEALIAALPETRRRERERREREEQEEVLRVLGATLRIQDDGVIALTEEAGPLLAAIMAGDVASFARLVDPEVREAFESAAGAYQLEQLAARYSRDPRWSGLLTRSRRHLSVATFAVRITSPVRWDKPRFVIDFERSPFGANGLLAGVVYASDSLNFSVGNASRFKCHPAGLPVLFPQRSLYPQDCEFSLAGLPRALMGQVEDSGLFSFEFRWTGLGEVARGAQLDSDYLVSHRALRFEPVPVRVMKDVRVEVLDAEGRVVWSAK
jgi:tetratricopeptide (TPR) repeat protein